MAFFVHPQHGATNASESDAPALEQQGWKLSTPQEWFRMNGKQFPGAAVAEAQPDQSEPAKRRGRPPKAK
jgi:hypothetical protein